MKKLRVIEVFAGIGAYSEALNGLGINHEVVAAVEFDRKTMNCYNVAHGSNFEDSDVTKIDAETLPECDMVCYSPPCQSFSVAGKGEGVNDVRGTLFWDALKIIEAKKPAYAIMENVKNLTGKKHRPAFDAMLAALADAGYVNHWKVLNSKEHGVPQNRERVFVVSVRKDLAVTDFAFPEPHDNGVRLRDILEPVVDEKYYIDDAKCAKLIEELNKGKGMSNIDEPGGLYLYDSMAFSKDVLPGFSRCLKANIADSAVAIPQLITVGNVNPSGNGNVYFADGLAPTVTTNKGEGAKILVESNEINVVGSLRGCGMPWDKRHESSCRVYGVDGICPSVTAGGGGGVEPKVLVDNSLQFVGGIGSKDWAGDGKGLSRNYPQGNRVYSTDGIATSLTSQGVGSYGGATGLYMVPQYRIRKLTPLECARLQGFSDEFHTKLVSAGISNSQLYKVYGNSITVTVLQGIFKALLCQSVQPSATMNTEEGLHG